MVRSAPPHDHRRSRRSPGVWRTGIPGRRHGRTCGYPTPLERRWTSVSTDGNTGGSPCDNGGSQIAPGGPIFAHLHVTKEQARLVLVVRATAKLNVLHRGRAAGGVRLHMMELEERRLLAAPTATHEGAPPFIPPPDGAPNRGGNVPRTVVGDAARTRRSDFSE